MITMIIMILYAGAAWDGAGEDPEGVLQPAPELLGSYSQAYSRG